MRSCGETIFLDSGRDAALKISEVLQVLDVSHEEGNIHISLLEDKITQLLSQSIAHDAPPGDDGECLVPPSMCRIILTLSLMPYAYNVLNFFLLHI